MPTHVVLASRDSKLTKEPRRRPVAATYRGFTSCGPCPISRICYAAGRIEATARRGSDDLSPLAALAASLPTGGALRLNVSGDLFNPDGSPDREYIDAASALAGSRPDVAIWTYTHGWRVLPFNPVPGVVVNASCETAADIEQAASQGWPTVVVDAGGPDSLVGRTVAGRKVVTCPAAIPGSTRDCESCRLCARGARASTVAFPTHGSAGKAKGAALLSTLRS